MSTVAGVSTEAVRAANLLTAGGPPLCPGSRAPFRGWVSGHCRLLAAGADGQARTELTDALGLPADGAEVHASRC